MALDTSIFTKNFETFSLEISGIVKWMSSGILLLQKASSLSKLEFVTGSFIFEAIDTKNLLNSLAISLLSLIS